MTKAKVSVELKILVGEYVEHRGARWQITHLDGINVRLTHFSGQTDTLPLHEFFHLPYYRRIIDERKAKQQGAIDRQVDTLFDSVPEILQKAALQRLDHIHEAVTGFLSGSSERPKIGEPRPEYDPSNRSEAERFKAKARELSTEGHKVSDRTLRRQRDNYQLRGLIALVDARQLRREQPLGRHPVEVIEATRTVINEATNKSTVTKKKHVSDIYRNLKIEMSNGTLKLQSGLPSYSGLSRLIDNLSVNKYTHGSAKLRRSMAARPQRSYQMLTPTRVGEYVVIDASTYDVWGFDSITGRKVRHRLVVAIDVFSRCILTARFFEQDPKGIDVTFLLHDIIAPKVAPPEWPEQALLPYIGIPEALIIEMNDLPQSTRLKSIPFARPDNLVIDNGKIFVSKVFESACERLGISLISARPYTGNDKSHVERFFETARDGFCVHLPGYTGNNPINRGVDPEAEAYYFRSELETAFHLWLAKIYHERPHSGLQSHSIPSVKFTPLEMFQAGVSAAGHLHIPTDQNLYQQLLESEWRKIHAYGIEYNGIYYDSPELTPFRNASCPYSLKGNGKWPFKVDSRDLRYIHFQIPETGNWIRIPRRNSKFADAPFTAVNLEFAREKVIAEGRSPRKHKELSDALESLLSEQRTQVAKNTLQRRREVKGLHQLERALADQEQMNKQRASSIAMDITETIQETTPEVILLPGEGFGSVDELDSNVANVFARGNSSYWNSSEDEE